MANYQGGPRNNRNNKRRPDYFTQNIEQFGEDFLYKKSIDTVKKDANKIFKDLAYGNINIITHGKYFSESSFTNALYMEASTNYYYNWYTYQGLITFMQHNNMNDTNLIAISNRHKDGAQAYYVISKYLGNIIRDISIGNFNNINDHLIQASNELKSYRQGLNCSFIVIENQ